MTDFWERVKDAGASIGRVLKDAVVNTGEVLKDAGATTGEALKEASQAAGRGAIQAARGAADLYERWLGEHTGTILAECPVAKNILEHRATFEQDPEIFGRLYNVRMRPLITAASLAAGGAGAAVLDEALSRVTRHIFDGDQLVGGALADRIADLVGSDLAGTVNRFMDTVPGADAMGGGWLHRVQHGHDIEALFNIAQEYGSEGVIQGLYHIFGRDFFTPAGIPILPSGSEQVLDFLITHVGLTAEAAADLVSLNSVEAMAVVAIVIATKLAWDCFKDYRERAELQKLVERASSATESGDLITASALFQEALAVKPQEGTISFALGMTCYRMRNHVDAFLHFRDATSWLARSEPMIEVGGAALSLRGTAAGMALASIDAPARASRDRANSTAQLQTARDGGCHGVSDCRG